MNHNFKKRRGKKGEEGEKRRVKKKKKKKTVYLKYLPATNRKWFLTQASKLLPFSVMLELPRSSIAEYG